jgi:SAM-dependent methyltransferase
MSETKLNLGCGEYKIPGWTNIDSVPDFKPDLVEDVTTLPSFQDNSVDAIYAGHIAEHLIDLEVALCRWCDLLKPGGTLTITVPDHEKTLDYWCKGETFPALGVGAVQGMTRVMTGFSNYSEYFSTMQASSLQAEAAKHRRVFDLSLLAICFKALGLVEIERLMEHECMPVNCWVADWQLCLFAKKPTE